MALVQSSLGWPGRVILQKPGYPAVSTPVDTGLGKQLQVWGLRSHGMQEELIHQTGAF